MKPPEYGDVSIDKETSRNWIGGIEAEPVQTCSLCGRNGDLKYPNLHDRLYDVPGTWSIWSCSHCQLGWLNPRPLEKEIPKLYRNYHTHQETHTITLFDRGFIPAVKRYVLARRYGYRFPEVLLPPSFVGWLAKWIPGLAEAARASVLWVPGPPEGRLLDIGCGNGEFLYVMSRLGWEVEGLEPDPVAAEFARQHYHLKITCGRINDVSLPEASFDVVTLSHVIEHVPDPVEMLQQCWRLVKPGGRLIVVTPNFRSLGARWFKASWFPLEPPRHLYLFTVNSLVRCAEQAGLSDVSIRTSARMARWVWYQSREIARSPHRSGMASDLSLSPFQKLMGAGFQLMEHLMCYAFPAGEELVLKAIRK